MKMELGIKIKLIFGTEILDLLAAPVSQAFVERLIRLWADDNRKT